MFIDVMALPIVSVIGFRRRDGVSRPSEGHDGVMYRMARHK